MQPNQTNQVKQAKQVKPLTVASMQKITISQGARVVCSDSDFGDSSGARVVLCL